MSRNNVRWFADLGLADLDQVGGKNASLGEMIANLVSAGSTCRTGSPPPRTRSAGSRATIEERINAELAALDVEDVRQLAEVGRRVRQSVLEQPFPEDLERDIREAFERLDSDGSGRSRCGPARPPRICRTRRSPGSRRPSSTSAGSTRC